MSPKYIKYRDLDGTVYIDYTITRGGKYEAGGATSYSLSALENERMLYKTNIDINAIQCSNAKLTFSFGSSDFILSEYNRPWSPDEYNTFTLKRNI